MNPLKGQISRNGATVRLESRTLRLLLCLAAHPGEVVSIDTLLSEVWPGVIVTPDSVYQAVASLRRLLGDDPKEPAYIVTVQRQGYRMIADVETAAAAPSTPSGAGETVAGSRRSRSMLALLSAAIVILIAVGLLFERSRLSATAPATAASGSSGSVAVLPFLDLTSQKMDEEYFADGITEELIDQLSKIPGLRVPTSTASFYFKGKKAKVTEIAQALGVAYVLDGSIRQSADRLRIATRLVRADTGLVVWSETYDRPLDNHIKVQEEIASEVARIIQARITR